MYVHPLYLLHLRAHFVAVLTCFHLSTFIACQPKSISEHVFEGTSRFSQRWLGMLRNLPQPNIKSCAERLTETIIVAEKMGGVG